MTIRHPAALALLAVLPALASPAAAASQHKQTPACSAIDFRPVGSSLPDGETQAGMYPAKFGRLEVMAKVQGGQAVDYYLLVNGKPAAPLQGDLPKSSESCLKAKHVALPLQKVGGGCVGARLRVVIDKTHPKKLLALFAQDGGVWKFCRASTAQ
jgi:hypothetical protein